METGHGVAQKACVKEVCMFVYSCVCFVSNTNQIYKWLLRIILIGAQLCPSLSEPNNGMINCSGASYEDTCSFTCNTGYELTGSDTRTCQNDGSWNGTISTCERGTCNNV